MSAAVLVLLMVSAGLAAADVNRSYMHARYYSPEIGRFISVDPVGGTSQKLRTWNRYAYAHNNPIRLVDPNGETPWDLVDPAFFLASIGNLWWKALTGRHITAADNLQVAGDAVGMIPIVPALGTAGRVVKEGVEHGADAVKASSRGAVVRGLWRWCDDRGSWSRAVGTTSTAEYRVASLSSPTPARLDDLDERLSASLTRKD